MKISKILFMTVLSVFLGTILLIDSFNQSSAATSTTNTTLGITAGSFSFTKDIGTTMNTYFGHSPNVATSIDVGSYSANIGAISVFSNGTHRFTASDLLGGAFTVTIQSSALTVAGGSIPASSIGYTGTAWLGTGKPLTAAPTSAVDIGTAPVTFVSRNDATGLSVFSQEITLKIAIPAAQKPGSYIGLITFTY